MNIKIRHPGSLSTISEEQHRQDPLNFPLLCCIFSLSPWRLLSVIFLLELGYILIEFLHVQVFYSYNYATELLLIYVVFMGCHIIIVTVIFLRICIKPDLHLRQSMILPHFWIFTRSMAIIWDIGNTIYAIFAYIPFGYALNFADLFCLIDVLYAVYVFYCSIWIFRCIKRLCMRNPWSPSVLSLNPDWRDRNQLLLDGETSIHSKKSIMSSTLNQTPTNKNAFTFNYQKKSTRSVQNKQSIPGLEGTTGYYSEYESQDEEFSIFSNQIVNNLSPKKKTSIQSNFFPNPVKKFASSDNIDPDLSDVNLNSIYFRNFKNQENSPNNNDKFTNESNALSKSPKRSQNIEKSPVNSFNYIEKL